MRYLPLVGFGLAFGLAGCAVDGTSNGPAADVPLAGSGGDLGKGGDASPGGAASGSPAGGPPRGGAGSSGGTPSTSGGGTEGGGTTSSGPTCRAKGDGKSTITLINQCDRKLSFRGSDIEGGDLAPGEHACRDVGSDVESLPARRFWGFVGEDPGGERHTLAELTLNTDFNDFDWYNISHVDAFNLPMELSAVGMKQCRTLRCPTSLLPGCPEVGQVKDSTGQLISCYSPSRDDQNSAVARYFEASCNDAYSWSGDDGDSVVACAGEDYDVVFCP